ncbi:hypothetical protein [Phytohabitans houttuyneae]|uniref:Uncharacterized protein n=1 Tax=Phytohabitans houttuyneae TaxID=1076126 RepID=A0A6V8KIS3_9ACTN|nr:hypothetical protein [Phytohabitans houttuyneae]GFJ81607.1 hypothetical protein Phou_057870 [Phytohabitans houttuyneae]
MTPDLRSVPPPRVPEAPGGGVDGPPWSTVAYVGGGGALLAVMGLLLVPLAYRRSRRPAAGGEARFLAGYPPPRVTARDLPGRPGVTVTLRLAADPDHRRPP